MDNLIKLIEQYLDAADRYEVRHMLLQIKKCAQELDAHDFEGIGMELIYIRYKSNIMQWLDIEDDLFEHKVSNNLFSSTEKKFILYRIIDEVYNAQD